MKQKSLLARTRDRWQESRRERPAPERPAEERPPEAPLDRIAVGAAAAVGLVALLVYLVTVEPTLPTGDSGELISAAYVLGVAHPPGYPLFTLLGHLATLVPVGSPAARVNVLSCVLDAAAVAVVFLAAYRVIGRRTERAPALVAAAAGAWLLAFSTLYWNYSEVAEVFALNNLFAAVLLLLGLEWSRRPERVRLLWAFMLVFGLALTNQLTIVLLVPAFLVLAWAGRRAMRSARLRDLAVAAGALVAGLLPYLYLPVAASSSPAVNWGDPRTVGRFLDVVRRTSYGTFSLTADGKHGSIGEQLGLIASTLTHAFVGVGLVLAVLGLAWAWRRQRMAGAALTTAFLVAGPVFVAYANPAYPDELTKGIVERFFILPSIPLAILASLGAFLLLERAAAATLPAIRPRLAAGIAAAAVLATPVAAAAAHYRTADHSGDRVALHYGEDILASLPSRSLLIMRGDENFTSLDYLQIVEHRRPDVVTVDAELLKLPTYVTQLRREHPDVVIPFASYDGGVHTSLNDLVRANIGRRPVYVVGSQEETRFGRPFDALRAGLVRHLVPKGRAPNAYALLLGARSLGRLHWPAATYPVRSWEAAIADDYALAASDAGYAQQRFGGASGVARAERMYRMAIRLDPSLASPYKNLGLLLHDNGGNPKEVARLWRRFLQLDPTDSQAAAIRSVLATL